MLFTPGNYEDIHRYYRNTYIKLKEYGDQLFFLTGIDPSRVVGKHESGQDFIIYLDNATPYEVDFILPHKSFFQVGKDAVLLERIPAQQYYRGLCSSNCQMTHVKSLSSSSSFQTLELSFDLLKAFVSKKKFYSLSGAIGAADVLTAALSSRMMYHRNMKTIFIDFLPVARVVPSKTAIYLTRPIFKDEISDMLQSHGESLSYQVFNSLPPEIKKVKTKTALLMEEMGALGDLE